MTERSQVESSNDIARRKYLALTGLGILGVNGCSSRFENNQVCIDADSEVNTDAVTATTAEFDPVTSGDVTQWGVFEATFTSTGSYTDAEKYSSVVLDGTFTGPDGTTRTVPGFWDGGDTFRIRFSPPKAGTWTYDTNSNEPSLDSKSGEFDAATPTQSQIDANPNYRGALQISDDNRYFEYADGTPFLWIGGTAWDLPLMRAEDDWKRYVIDRTSKGFTVVQMAWNPVNEPEETNKEGETFVTYFDEIDPEYFQTTDEKILLLLNAGMIPVIAPHWGEAFDEMTASERELYHRHMIARYHSFHAVWATSGEYHKASTVGAPQRETGEYIHTTDGTDRLTSIHPGPTQKNVSSMEDFENEDWIDFHMHQTHSDEAEYTLLSQEYARDDGPIVSAEPGYDGEFGEDRSEVRKDMYQVMFSGFAAGYTYGVTGVAFDYSCIDNINKKSSLDVERMVDLLNSFQWWELINDQQIIISGEGSGENKKIATRLPDGTRQYVYFPSNSEAEIDLEPIETSETELLWYGLFASSENKENTYVTSNTVTVQPPEGWEDCLLIMKSV